MSELLQPGQHPDADQLSAFVEHVLPAHEHDGVLAHLAVCPACRHVVAVSMPPVEELPEVQPVPVRRPWFSGWNLAWPVAAAFAALILMAVLVHRGGNAPPPQIAEAHLPQAPAGSVTTAPAQAGLPARAGSASLTAQGRSTHDLQAANSVAGNAPAEPAVANQAFANLPIDNRNVQSLPPSAAEPSLRVMGGMGAGSAAGLGVARQAQASETGATTQQQPSGSAGAPTAYAMARPAAAPIEISPASPSPLQPSASVSRAVSGAATVEGEALNALSDDTVAVDATSNASSTVISGTSLAGLAGKNIALHPLPSGLPVLSVAAAGQTILALDSGNSLFLSADAGMHWKRVHAKWQGRAVKVALAVTPAAPTAQPVAPNNAAIRGELQGRVSTATAIAAIAPLAAGGGATLSGQVTDPAGAVIPGAAVRVTNATTAASVTLTTDAAGRYFAGGLAAGTYRIDATARGFAGQELNLNLTASQRRNADLKLQVGQTSETVTVTSAPAQLETESSAPSAEVLQLKAKRSAAPVFAITTDAGERWVSADGRNWKRE